MASKTTLITAILLLLLCISALAQRAIVLSESFYSASVQLKLKYTVVLPESYENLETERYTVVYLLHGHTGNYTSWITYAQLPIELANQYNCIIILPDGGNSWYVNWSGQTDGKPHQWENMLVKDLIPDVDKKYRTINKKSGRALGGLSMGGFGALAVGLKNPDMFGFIFSSAGAINFCKNIKQEMARDTVDWNSPQLWSDDKKVVDITGFSKERTPQGFVFKTYADVDRYDPYTLFQKIDTASLPHIHLDCGNQDDFQKDAYQFLQQVKLRTSRYSFISLPGGHDVPYWRESIQHTFLVMRHIKFF
ncbi:MAG TPA: alpha/beta hydrolase family protein [Cyclobacteriaceae bacterium]|nr:alpha/beta hydrolase family protein [Cyclobacteriaceae bacterium]